MPDLVAQQFDLTGKLAVVSGATGGIGRAAAKVLADLGAGVVLAGRNEVRLSETRELLPAGAHVQTVIGDARQQSHIDELVAEGEANGGYDIFFNSVGTNRRKPLLEATNEDMAWLWEINMGSVWNLTQALLPQMVAKGAGKIIHMCSIGFFIGLVDKSMYAVTNGALLKYVRSSAVELAPMGIQVNGLAPGFVDTPMTHDHIHGPREHEFLSAIPDGRFATVQDLYGPIALFASTASDHITGQVLIVDGGETIS